MEKVASSVLGFCLDNSPDKIVGVAANGLLVGSQDVAHDFDLLKKHGVTHVLNVGCGIPNAFEDVSGTCAIAMTFMASICISF